MFFIKRAIRVMIDSRHVKIFFQELAVVKVLMGWRFWNGDSVVFDGCQPFVDFFFEKDQTLRYESYFFNKSVLGVLHSFYDHS